MMKYLLLFFAMFPFNSYSQNKLKGYDYIYNINYPNTPSYYYLSAPHNSSPGKLKIKFLDVQGEVIGDFNLGIDITLDSGQILHLETLNGLIEVDINSHSFSFVSINPSFTSIKGGVSFGDNQEGELTVILGNEFRNNLIIESKTELTQKQLNMLIYDILMKKKSKLLEEKKCVYYWQL